MSTQKADCPFCNYSGPSKILKDFGRVIVFEPLDPVTPGHLLVVHKEHSQDFSDAPEITAEVAKCAAEFAAGLEGDCNLISSKGQAATQTVDHLHLHIVPRTQDDGLLLPWSA